MITIQHKTYINPQVRYAAAAVLNSKLFLLQHFYMLAIIHVVKKPMWRLETHRLAFI